MADSWDWIEEELRKLETEFSPETTDANSDLLPVLDAISVADFWKRRYDEERALWERKLELKEDEKSALQQRALEHEQSIKELAWRFKELESRWEKEKLLLEDRLRAKEIEASLEQKRLEWESRLKLLEEENKQLKLKLSALTGVPLTPDAITTAYQPVSPTELKSLKEQIEQNRQEAEKHLQELAEEKEKVARQLAEQEQKFLKEKELWQKSHAETKSLFQKAMAKLKYLREKEQENFTTLEDLARGLAHRVRNYLGIMSGTLQLAASTTQMPSDIKEQLGVVENNIQEMLNSIEEFLNLSRLPSLNMAQHSLNDILKKSLETKNAELKSANINITTHLAENLPAIRLDEKLFMEAIGHLINNARESMPDGGNLVITTRIINDAETAGQPVAIEVRITDSGSGISENHLKKIFQPYFSTKKGHKGLGLTVARRIISLHNGSLTIESKKGEGTTAIISLVLPD